MLEIVRKNDDILKYVVMVITVVALLVLSESGALASTGGGAGSEFYSGDTESFVTKSVLTIKIVRFIAIFVGRSRVRHQTRPAEGREYSDFGGHWRICGAPRPYADKFRHWRVGH